jgi:hypothetical protein
LLLKRATDYLGLTVWAMRERIWAGHIPVVQFLGGRKRYFDINDLENFIQKNKLTIGIIPYGLSLFISSRSFKAFLGKGSFP